MKTIQLTQAQANAIMRALYTAKRELEMSIDDVEVAKRETIIEAFDAVQQAGGKL